MTAHTPGPWVFEELRAVHDGDGYVLTEGSRVVVCHHGGAYSMGLPREEVLANARLIATAPDLLAALVDLFAMVQGETPSLLEDHHMFGVVSAAITKAKGRS